MARTDVLNAFFFTGERERAFSSVPTLNHNDLLIGKDDQPAHLKDFVKTQDDNGGVHINSGIPNKAFYELAIRLGGFAWERAGRIWYVTLRDRLREDSMFQECADATFDVARELYGADSVEQRAVREAWDAVGVKTGQTAVKKAKAAGVGRLRVSAGRKR